MAVLASLLIGSTALLGACGSSGSSSTSSTPSSLRIKTIPINTPENPFTPPLAQDAVGVPPVQTTQPTEVTGDQVGLYGGSKKINVCDKAQLLAFLQSSDNRAIAEGWATTLGISYADIGSYLNRTTSAILRSDTLVTNHGWENGQVTGYPAVLQAGTAVLINDHGVPVTRCYCGNPLTPPFTPPSRTPSQPSQSPSEPSGSPSGPSQSPSAPSESPSGPSPSTSRSNQTPDGLITALPTGTEVFYGPTWPSWTPTSITLIGPAASVLKQFTFVNVFAPSETYLVLVGKADTSVPGSGPVPVSPTPTQTRTTTPSPTRSSTSSSPTPTHSSTSPSPTRSGGSQKPSALPYG